MAFFLTQSKPAPAGKVQRKQLSVKSGVRGCSACTLRETWPRISSAKMPTYAETDDPDILILGEAPGKTEDQKNRQFVGDSGLYLRQLVPGRFNARIAWQNSVRCRPDKNRTPTPQEVYACSEYLDDDIDRLPIKYILGVGAVPLARFMPRTTTNAGIGRIHGNKFPVRVGKHTMWYFPVLHPSYVMRNEGKYDEGPVFPPWAADMRKFFREFETWGKPQIYDLDPRKVIIPGNREEAENLVRRMAGPTGIDIETTDLRPYNKGARLLTASMSDGDTTIAFPINHPDAQNEWGLDFLLTIAETRHWVAHNALFEYVWLLYHSAQENRKRDIHIFEDTMALARLYHQRESILELGLVSNIHLGVNVKALSMVKAARILDYPLKEILVYNGLDSMATAPIYHKLIREVKRDNYEALLARVESFAMMQLLGLDCDAVEARKLQDEWAEKQAVALEQVRGMHEVRQYERKYGEFNIGSPEQVGRCLVEFGNIALPPTKDEKAYVTDEETLVNLAPDSELVKGLLDWREADKLRGTYIQPLLNIPKNTVDGRLHPCYSPLLVASFRSQSEDPNSQNFPKRKHRELRRPIVVPQGYVMAAFDYGQLQVRILAMESKDRRLIKELLKGVDIHSRWLNNALEIYPTYLERLAHETNETDEKKIRKAGRDIIKSDFVFNSFFGGGIVNIARRTKIPEKLVRELQGEFWREYAGVADWQKKKRREYRETGAVTALNGWVRRSIMWGNEPINSSIQTGEAEIVFGAQTELSRKAWQQGDMHLHPRINVHDDLTFILPDDDRLAGYIETVAHSMVKLRFDWQIVPLTVEVKMGKNWCDLEEVALFKGDYYDERGQRLTLAA